MRARPCGRRWSRREFSECGTDPLRIRYGRHTDVYLMLPEPEYSAYVIASTAGGVPKLLKAKTATIKHLGWDQHFDEYVQWVMANRPQVPGGGWKVPLSFNPKVGGRRHHLYLPDDQWSTKGTKRVAFRVGRNVAKRDLAELLHFTQIDWTGCKEIGGTYWSRQELEAVHAQP